MYLTVFVLLGFIDFFPWGTLPLLWPRTQYFEHELTRQQQQLQQPSEVCAFEPPCEGVTCWAWGGLEMDRLNSPGSSLQHSPHPTLNRTSVPCAVRFNTWRTRGIPIVFGTHTQAFPYKKRSKRDSNPCPAADATCEGVPCCTEL